MTYAKLVTLGEIAKNIKTTRSLIARCEQRLHAPATPYERAKLEEALSTHRAALQSLLNQQKARQERKADAPER